MSILLSSGTIGSMVLKNRIVMAPMCTYQSNESGEVMPFHKYHYAARALGGVGLIIVEACAVESRGRISDNDLGLWDDAQIAGHKQLTDACHEFGSKVALQLAHAGRKSASKHSTPIAPSAIAFSGDYQNPLTASIDDIKAIKAKFVSAANRAKQAGYDGVEIHAAHGYFLFEFLSPYTNKRDDEYGGSLQNRCKLILEVVSEIKRSIDIALIVRISADEWMDDGFCIDDAKYLAAQLQEIGIDALHVSAGGNHLSPQNAPQFVPFYQCGYAKEIKQTVSTPIIAVGLIDTPTNGEGLLLGGICDFVAYGRELLRSPNLAYYGAQQFNEKDKIAYVYQRAF